MGDEPSTSLRVDQPYRCEYAKSARASCRSCKGKIIKDELRLARMVKMPAFDGVSPHWYHFDCFFEKNRPKSTGDMAHFSNLRFEDQKKIEAKIGNASGATACLSDFGVEYSKSGKAACVLCESKISLNEVRISKTDEESDAAVRLGRALPRFFHVDCFVSARQELGFFDSADKLPNFDGLEASDRQILKKKLPKLSGTKRKVAAETNGTKGQSEPKKSKVDKVDKELEKSLQEQSNLLYKYIDQLKTLKANELDVLLLHNNYDPPKDRGRKAEVVADAMAFGALSKCPECKTGQLYFRIAGYICSGMVSDCVKCVYETVKPARKPFKVPTEYKEIYEFLAKYKYKPRVRVMGKVQGPVDAVDIAKVASSSNGNDNESEHKIDPSKPLKDHKIVIFGKLGKPLKDYKKAITDLGGSVVTNFDRTVLFGITNDKEIDKGSDKVEQSEQNNVILVNEKVIEEMKKANIEDIPSVIVKHGLSEWGAQDVAKRFVNLVNKSKVKSFKSGSGSKSKSAAFPERQKMVIKDGTVVDPQSELEEIAIVYKEGDKIYSEVLNKVDLQANKNSYYKLQLLKDENRKNRFWVFTSWGRVGTDIGGTKTYSFSKLEDARFKFEEIFFDKTGQQYCNRRNMTRKASFYYPLEVSYAVDGDRGVKMEIGKSELPPALQRLVMMLFDVQLMEKEMKEFELDMTKMPLGKLSKKQILSAYNVLSEISRLVDDDSKKASAKLVSQCEGFYTLIPHTFENDKPPLIRTSKEVERKREMLDALMEMEIACELITSVKSEDSTDDPIKQHYLKLGTDLSVLDTKEPEYKLIDEYLVNTHAKTHAVKLKIKEAFKVRRHGEEERYKKYTGLNNKMLLWHGSRITNFASILSQGLRIAPPEAPVTGYMFGKGVYFADMATKSANYCHPQSNNNTGILALCEVALGEMLELTQADFITDLPKGKHSVKGVGKTAPDPKKSKTIDEGVIVPCGPGKPTGVKDTSLLYNEFIVYDVNQIKIRYLLMVEFDNKLF
ncbi:poly [ADP-ribose] polymerase 1-like [Panonychus citri]|uniref:poly [ADP-ribose] polymerase 1-like n=1 Tax=Panonychus citri TaxID=50023 RepID=UPI002307D7D4|nr:poly [ADP-ribose] polymerase 1-like [Panonychus citri]XP_053201316.1 poly [ADP-ribose] polymerase 1-like [Panonychus citri]